MCNSILLWIQLPYRSDSGLKSRQLRRFYMSATVLNKTRMHPDFLNLENNFIFDSYVPIISWSLENNASLAEACLGGNIFGENGCQSLRSIREAHITNLSLA